LKAADEGLDTVQYKVGTFYLSGKGVDKDLDQAKIWLGKAAKQGYPPAQFQLGKLYVIQRNRDYSQALAWLERAQNNGYEPATREILKVKQLAQ